MYKLIGAIIVVLAVAAAVLPLWLGGDASEETESVPVETKALGDSDTPAESTSPSAPSGAEDERRAAADTGEGGERSWWKKSPETSRPKESEPSPPEGKRALEQSPKEPSEEITGPTQEELPPSGASAPPSSAEEENGVETPPSPRVEPPDSSGTPRPGEEAQGADLGRPEDQGQPPTKEPPYWTVMVGSFQDLANAKKLRARLQEKDFSARIQTRTIEGREWNRVLVGALASREEAKGMVPRLKQAGYDDTLVMKVE